MLKKMLVGCGAGLLSVLVAIPVAAQEVATLVLRDGQRPSGELIDLNASGYTLRVNGRTEQFAANDVAAVEFVGGAAPSEARARIDAGQPLVVLRSGQIVEGRLSDIGGTHPLRLTVDTSSGPRDYTSNDVAQIYLFAPARAAAAATQAPQPPPQQDPNTGQPRRGQQRQDQGTQPQARQPLPQQQQGQDNQQRRGQPQDQQGQNSQQRRDPQQQRQDQNARQPGARLSQQRQAQLVEQQQQRLTQYRQHLDGQQRVVQQQAAQLQQQHRTSQSRVQQGYLDRLRQQQAFLQNGRHPDYDNDPYFYTAPTYRYSRDGQYYETNQYGADSLQQAVNFGYEQGFLTGEADRTDRWRGGYQDSYAYRDANYGYNGYYVERDDYNYYFREGFKRGYEDGYGNRSQYGRNTSGSHSLLDAILSQILGFQPLR